MFILFALTGSNASGFSIPEKFQYDLTLAGITVGSLTLELKDQSQNIQITSKAASQKWVSLFYEFNDIAVSSLKKAQQKDMIKTFPFVPQTYRVRLNEGKNKIDKEFVFDHAKKNVVYTDNLKKEKARYVIKDLSMDPLSGLYYIRRLPLEVGKSVVIRIFNNRMFYKVAIGVLRKEILKTSIGTVNTIVIRTNMTAVGDGIFYKPGDITIWLTDDSKRIPVLIEKRLNELVEGKIPDYLKGKIPDFVKNKLAEGTVKASIQK